MYLSVCVSVCVCAHVRLCINLFSTRTASSPLLPHHSALSILLLLMVLLLLSMRLLVTGGYRESAAASKNILLLSPASEQHSTAPLPRQHRAPARALNIAPTAPYTHTHTHTHTHAHLPLSSLPPFSLSLSHVLFPSLPLFTALHSTSTTACLTEELSAETPFFFSLMFSLALSLALSLSLSTSRAVVPRFRLRGIFKISGQHGWVYGAPC